MVSRFLSISLGRPGLIPLQHVRVEKPQDPNSFSWMSNMVSPDLTDSLVYFNYLMLVHNIVSLLLSWDADRVLALSVP